MTRLLVVDATIPIRLILPGSERRRYRALVAQWQRDGYALYAPTLWLYETTSAVSKAVRFATILPEEGRKALDLIRQLGVELVAPDEAQVMQAFEWTLRLNRAAAYDSFYLALAETLSSELWTADQRLRNAVGLPWVRWAEEPA